METPNVETTNTVNPNMKICKHCGHQVAKNAKSCPNCGGKLKRKTGCLISVIIAILLLVFLFSMCSTSSTESQAENADFEIIYNDCISNITSAKNKYEGNTYKFAAKVKSIEDGYITVVPVDFPVYSSLKNWYLVDVSMPEEEIMKVKAEQVVNISAKISELEDSSITMKNGDIIDDIIAFDGEITGFTLNDTYTKHLMKVEKFVSDNLKITYYIEAGNADEFENIDSATFNDVVFTTGDYITGTAQMNGNGAYYDSYIVTAVATMEKTSE